MKNGILTSLLILILLIIIPFEMILSNNLNPLLFGVSFGIINRKLLKYKFIKGIIFTVLCSYISFFIGLFGLFGLGEIMQKVTRILSSSLDGNVLIVFSGLLASLSLYLLFTKIYQVEDIKNGFLIMLFSYLLIPILVFIIPLIFNGIIITEFFRNYNLAWLMTVSFFLSYAFYQNRVTEGEYLNK